MDLQCINTLGGHPDLAKYWRGTPKCQEGAQILPGKKYIYIPTTTTTCKDF